MIAMMEMILMRMMVMMMMRLTMFDNPYSYGVQAWMRYAQAIGINEYLQADYLGFNTYISGWGMGMGIGGQLIVHSYSI